MIVIKTNKLVRLPKYIHIHISLSVHCFILIVCFSLFSNHSGAFFVACYSDQQNKKLDGTNFVCLYFSVLSLRYLHFTNICTTKYSDVIRA